MKRKFGLFLASMMFMLMANSVMACSCGYLSPEALLGFELKMVKQFESLISN